jgi:hypothetical protein
MPCKDYVVGLTKPDKEGDRYNLPPELPFLFFWEADRISDKSACLFRFFSPASPFPLIGYSFLPEFSPL